MAAIRINLFGRLVVFVDNHPFFVGTPHTKPLELFAYLLIHRQRTHPREVLATLLWPELTPAHAKKNLRKVLHTLQHFLVNVVGPNDPPLLLIEHNWITINPAINLQLDIAIFEQAYILIQQHPSGIAAHDTQALIAAVELYDGELLAGLYTDWCLYERERLENMYLELRHILLVYAEQHHAYAQAIEHGLEILRYDRANERTYCDLMRLYYRSRNRSAALHQYQQCVSALAHELGVNPGVCTQQLYLQICRDELDLTYVEPEERLLELQRELGADRGTRSQLQQIHAELQRVLQQVQDKLLHVERLLEH